MMLFNSFCFLWKNYFESCRPTKISSGFNRAKKTAQDEQKKVAQKFAHSEKRFV